MKMSGLCKSEDRIYLPIRDMSSTKFQLMQNRIDNADIILIIGSLVITWGIGAGAHGKLTDLQENLVRRFARHRIPDAYMQKAGSNQAVADEKIILKDDIILEFMMNALRLRDGFSTFLFSTRTSLPISYIQPLLAIALARELVLCDKDHIKPTEKGLSYLNELLEIFMPVDKQ